MTVESNKTSSNYCNLSWKSLENGSRDKSSLILDCLSRNTTVARIISGSATVSAIKQLKYSPSVSLTRGGGPLKNGSSDEPFLIPYCSSKKTAETAVEIILFYFLLS